MNAIAMYFQKIAEFAAFPAALVCAKFDQTTQDAVIE
jgi:hypothetical protein